MRLFYRDSAEMSGTALDPRIRETHACRRKNRIKQKVVADMTAAAGMVTSQAHTIRVATPQRTADRSGEHTSELQSLRHLVCRLLLEKKNKSNKPANSDPSTLTPARPTPVRRNV